MSLRLSGGRRLQSPSGSTARPTPSRVRLAMMNILAAELPGCRWLDLCCGSGVMACEALQRGAAAVVAVEQNRRHAAVARANLDEVQAGLAHPVAVRVACSEVCRWLSQAREEPFDLIYADPPYRTGLYAPICAALKRADLLHPGGTLLLECATAEPPELPAGWRLRDRRTYGSTTVLLLQIASEASAAPATEELAATEQPAGKRQARIS